MKEAEIRKLIDDFYEGKTTAEEEEILRIYLSGTDVPAEYSADRSVILGLAELSSVPETDPFLEKRISNKIRKHNTSVHIVLFTRYLSGAAAILLFAVGIYTLLNGYGRQKFKDTYDNPRIAYYEAINVLKTVSEKLNTGITELNRVNSFSSITEKSLESVDRSTEILTQTIDQISVNK